MRKRFLGVTEMGLERRQYSLGFTSGVVTDTYGIVVKRSSIVNDVVSLFETFNNHISLWEFSFENEEGSGPGPTKEFYSEFSRECQRHDLDLWIGTQYNGEETYVTSNTGLCPGPSTSDDQCDVMLALGKIMAKSLMDFKSMDIHLCLPAYKFLLTPQDIGVADLIYAMPSMEKFILDLVFMLKQKWMIENNELLTPEERCSAFAELKCDGYKLEDLEIDFTVPGYSDIEMKKGGTHVVLTHHNVEEYLELLLWSLFNDNEARNLYHWLQGINSYVPIEALHLFYPEELKSLFFNESTRAWDISFLEQNCIFDEGYDKDMPNIRFLFEVLSELNLQERKLFLFFATGCPVLPAGDLRSLNPRLTISPGGYDDENINERLPSAMTCTNLLLLPYYDSVKVTKEKLLMAINDGQGSFGFL